MSLGSIIKFLLQHPLAQKQPLAALWRFGSWQLRARISTNPVVVNWIEGTKFWMGKGWTGVTGNYYTGLHEFNDMAFLLHLLKPGDVFADVGANMGSYTILASGVCQAKTYAFEPVESTFQRLVANIELNQIQSLCTPVQAAIGAAPGTISFTQGEDTTNHVATTTDINTSTVPIYTLDEAVSQPPTLMKIDVEGFETAVLKGAPNILQEQSLKAIIIELNGAGGRYGYNDAAIHEQLLNLGFIPCSYEPFERKLSELISYGTHNTIYVRDKEEVSYILKNAPHRRILNLSL